MSGVRPEDIRGFLFDHFADRLRLEGKDSPEDLSDDYDLLLSGLIDSLDLLELTVALSEFSGREIDFEALDPEQITVVGPLCRFVAKQASSAEAAAS